MSRNKKIVLAFLTFSPLIGIFLYIFCFLFLFGSVATMDIQDDPAMIEDNIGYFTGTIGFAIMILTITILLSIGMTIYYIIHILNNKKLDKDKNEPLVWVLITLLAGYIGQFIYWYLKIWKDEPATEAVSLVDMEN